MKFKWMPLFSVLICLLFCMSLNATVINVYEDDLPVYLADNNTYVIQEDMDCTSQFAFYGSGDDNVTILGQNHTITGLGKTTANKYGLIFAGCNTVKVFNLSLEDFYYAIGINGGDSLTIGRDGTGNPDPLFEDCTYGVYGVNSPEDVRTTTMEFSRCTYGVYLTSPTEPRINGEFNDCDRPIYITSPTYGMVSYCSFANSTYDAIYIYGGSYIDVYNNILNTCESTAIYLNNVSYSEVYDNDINAPDSHGIRINDGNHHDINNNEIDDSGGYGIHVYLADNLTIEYNDIQDSYYSGILIAGSALNKSYGHTVSYNDTDPDIDDNNEYGIEIASTAYSVSLTDNTVEGYIADLLDNQSDPPGKAAVICSVYPNPFNPKTGIHLNLKVDSIVSIKIFNMLGKSIDLINNVKLTSGKHKFNFDGSKLATGVYFCKIKINDNVKVIKLNLIK